MRKALRITWGAAGIVAALSFVGALFIGPTTHRNEERICDHAKIAIGMSADEVIAACGNPTEINSDQTFSSTSSQWVYSVWGRSYVYFNNGHVSTVQWKDIP